MSLTPKYNKIIFSGLLMVCLLMPLQLVLAADQAAVSGVNSALGGLDNTANAGGVKTATTDLPTIIGQVVGAVLAFVGVVFFCLILWAGFGWMLAKGNEEEIKTAKETIFGAALGLLVILGAYAITNLIAEIFKFNK